MKKYFVIDTPEKLKAISDPLRIRLLVLLIHGEYTGKQLADVIEFSASKVHYHLKELEQHGFIHVVRTEEKNGIVQKFFRSEALDFVVSDDLLPSLHDDSLIHQESMVSLLRSAISRIYDAPEESFSFIHYGDEQAPPMLQSAWEVKGSKAEIKAWLEKYQALRQELHQIEQRHAARVAVGEVPDSEEVFFMVNVGFMTNTEHFKTDDHSLPSGYKIVNNIAYKDSGGESR